MNRAFSILLAVSMCASLAAAAGKKLQVKDLPAAVQKTVNEQSKHAQIANISKETEKGVTQFEIETLVNGKHRDFNVDTKGNLIATEEETSLDSIPAAAKAAIVKKAAGARMGMVETITKGSGTVYEASFTPKGGKAKEVMVNADGSEAKE
jgi:Na+-transporting NADH:ubiquinone oxidoreductase subunit NqrC